VKRVPQTDYFEMCGLGLIDFSTSSRNCTIIGKEKPSRARSYFVEDRIVEAYDLMKLPKGIEI